MPAFAAKLKTALCTFKTIKFVKVESVPLTLTHYGVMIFVVVYVLTFQVLSLSTTSGCNGGASERASEQARKLLRERDRSLLPCARVCTDTSHLPTSLPLLLSPHNTIIFICAHT